MITSNILHRVFFIKGVDYGTAFTVDDAGDEFLVTARHLLDTTRTHLALKLFYKNTWVEIAAEVVGHGKNDVDISVLRLSQRLTSSQLTAELTCGNMTFGQDVYFLGFPYKIWADVGEIMYGYPMPLVKKGTLSTLGGSDKTGPEMFYVDALNNSGFSGGPLIYQRNGGGNLRTSPFCICGVVSKFRVEQEPVLNRLGEPTGDYINYNTGFLVAYSTRYVIEMIQRWRSAGRSANELPR